MWHFLYFFPLPHQQGSFLPNLGISLGACSSPMSFEKNPIFPPYPVTSLRVSCRDSFCNDITFYLMVVNIPFYPLKTAPVSADCTILA